MLGHPSYTAEEAGMVAGKDGNALNEVELLAAPGCGTTSPDSRSGGR